MVPAGKRASLASTFEGMEQHQVVLYNNVSVTVGTFGDYLGNLYASSEGKAIHESLTDSCCAASTAQLPYRGKSSWVLITS